MIQHEVFRIRMDRLDTLCGGYKGEFHQWIKGPYENDKALVVYDIMTGEYEAIEKELRGVYSGYEPYHRSTKGNFKRVKKAFEKYSGIC